MKLFVRYELSKGKNKGWTNVNMQFYTVLNKSMGLGMAIVGNRN